MTTRRHIGCIFAIIAIAIVLSSCISDKTIPNKVKQNNQDLLTYKNAAQDWFYNNIANKVDIPYLNQLEWDSAYLNRVGPNYELIIDMPPQDGLYVASYASDEEVYLDNLPRLPHKFVIAYDGEHYKYYTFIMKIAPTIDYMVEHSNFHLNDVNSFLNRDPAFSGAVNYETVTHRSIVSNVMYIDGERYDNEVEILDDSPLYEATIKYNPHLLRPQDWQRIEETMLHPVQSDTKCITVRQDYYYIGKHRNYETLPLYDGSKFRTYCFIETDAKYNYFQELFIAGYEIR